MQRFTSLFLCLTSLYLSLYTHCDFDEPEYIVSPLYNIVFEQKTYTLVEGETKNITATFYPAIALRSLAKEKIQIDIEDASIIEAELINFSNANASIKLIAHKAGTTKIKISVEGIDKTFEAEINVKAKTNTNVPITGISLDKTELTIVKGNTSTLTALVSPENTTEDKSVLWTSSDEQIATVNATGEITAKAVGEAIITATSKSNNTLKATCKLIIVQGIIGITLNNTELTIAKGATATLTATVSPADASEDKTIVWTSSDEQIATVDENGKITTIEYGEVNIIATSKANANISDTCKVNVVVSTAPQITQLYFAKAVNDEVSYSRSQSTDTFYGIIDEEAKTINIEFYYIVALYSLTNVKLHFTLSPNTKVQVGGIEQKSGVTAVDFSSGSADYVVIAEDGITTQTYKVSLIQHTYAYIPGANFRTWLTSNYASAMKGDSLNTKHSSVITATEIYIYSKSIQDLTGIEFFTALFKLRCYDNALTELDLSKNVALEDFTCNDNQLKTLDMRGMRSTSNLIILTSSTSNPLVLVKVHENMRNAVQLKFLKTERGNNIKIQTYSAPAGSTKYTAVCCDYNPNAGSCTTPATNGICP